MDPAGVVPRALLLGAEGALALPLLYLLLLSVAALLAGRRAGHTASPAAAPGSPLSLPPPAALATTQRPRFALLIPAHDEEVVIGSLLASIAALDYPAALRDVYVIADNCTDETANVAREAGVAGVQVRERCDERQRGKGYAVRWLLEDLEREDVRYDGYVVVDADSQLSPNFLSALAAGLARGMDAQQGQYRVQNGTAAWTAGLRAVAFALINHLRPLGRSALGWSVGLKGNGMCFSRRLIERFGWAAYSLAEDAEYHLALVSAGVRVAYAPEAVVTSAMPTTLRQARSQQQRWERGRLTLARTHALALMRGAWRHRDLARLDAIAEVCLPPISTLVGLLALVVLGAVALRWGPGLVVASGLVVIFALHGAAGVGLARLSWHAYGALLYAPWYVIWKIGIYCGATLRRGDGAWVRTSRSATPLAARESGRYE
jgi:cellulose synthase/poly-beta-1,6-N-acetylglucosamine synthase-like glycosyltransferase